MAVIVCIEVVRSAEDLRARRTPVFEELYRRWYPDVVKLCRRLLSHSADPEATAQEAFIRAWMALDRFSVSRPFWPWVSVIARRLCLDDQRRVLRETSRTWGIESSFEERHPEEVFELAEDLRLVLRRIEELRPTERRALVLREFEGWSYDQIADFEGVSIESIRGSLKRARAAVRRSPGPWSSEEAVGPVTRLGVPPDPFEPLGQPAAGSRCSLPSPRQKRSSA